MIRRPLAHASLDGVELVALDDAGTVGLKVTVTGPSGGRCQPITLTLEDMARLVMLAAKTGALAQREYPGVLAGAVEQGVRELAQEAQGR